MIVCCGEALIDMLPRKLADGSDVFLPVPGGAIFNTAIALGRLGVDTAFVSSISNDMFGEQLIEALQSSKVDATRSVRSDHPTTLAFVKLENGHAQYSFFDENSAGRMLDIADLPELPIEMSALHFGAISLIPEPCGTAYETLMARHASQTVISLDPNIRPGFITNEKAHRARMARMIAKADIVKLSDEDLDWLVEDGGSADALIESWLDGASALVLVTKGADGVDAYLPNGTFSLSAWPVEVVDTVGAGDTFNAGLLSGLWEAGLLSKSRLESLTESQLTPALDLAMQTAAFVVARAGANPPWRHELSPS